MSESAPLLVVVLAGAAERWKCAPKDSPLAKADTPTLDRLASEGRVLGVRLIDREPDASDAGPLLALLGLDPADHETARASYLAAVVDFAPGPGECVASADFVALFRDRVADVEPGPLRPNEHEVLFEAASEALERAGFRLIGVSGTHHLVAGPRENFDGKLPSPEWTLGKPLERFVPRVTAHANAHRLARGALDGHEVNELRRELGGNGADMIWISGPGATARLQTEFDPAPAAFGHDPVWQGLCMAAGIDHKGDAEPHAKTLAKALKKTGLCFVHERRCQEDALLRDASLRATGIEKADRGVVAAAAEAVEQVGGRLMVLADRAWGTASGEPSADPVPVLLWGEGVQALASQPFTEAGARAAGEPLVPGHGLLAYVRHL